MSTSAHEARCGVEFGQGLFGLNAPLSVVRRGRLIPGCERVSEVSGHS
jgi:hypothetical protein